jgi:hypothetical protein
MPDLRENDTQKTNHSALYIGAKRPSLVRRFPASPARPSCRTSTKISWPGNLSRYSDSLRDGRSGDRIPVGGEIFHAHPYRPWGPSSLLYNGYRVFPGGKRLGCGVDHLPLSSAEVKERVGL